MRLGTKVLVITLATTLGLSGAVLWVVTSRVTQREQVRAAQDIRRAIAGYRQRLELQRQHIDGFVRQVMEEPVNRAQLDRLENEPDESKRVLAATQLREEIFGKTVARAVQIGQIAPAFHVLVNEAGEAMLT